MSFSLLLKSLLRRKVVTVLLLIQLALTLALLTNSAVLAWQARQLANQATGLQLDQVLQVRLKPTLPELRKQPALDELIERQLAAIRAVPGVQAASWSNQSPLVFGGMNGNIFVPDQQETTDVGMVPVQINGIAVKEVLDLQLLQGRWLEETDQGTDALVISDKLAKRLFGEQSPVGQAVSRGTVVGVVADVFMQRYADDQYYASYSYYSLPGADYGYQLLVKTAPGQLDQVRQPAFTAK